MGAHLVDGEFQSDKYPTCPRGKVPLSTGDPAAQDLIWIYAQRRKSGSHGSREVDAEFAADVEEALWLKGFTPPTNLALESQTIGGVTFEPNRAFHVHADDSFKLWGDDGGDQWQIVYCLDVAPDVVDYLYWDGSQWTQDDERRFAANELEVQVAAAWASRP